MSDADNGAARGKVGEEIFARVEALVKAEQITRTEAFQRVAQERGSRPGTVAANYYRIARQKGGSGLRPRGRRKASGGDVEAAIDRATAALAELAGIVRQQSRELEQLSEQVQQIDKLRALLAD